MPAQKSKVNLVPPSEFESSFWGKFLKWAVTTGRYLIIVTEMVVIIAFLTRFKLDEDLRRLNETINGQVNLLENMSEKENEFRNLQAKIALADQMLDKRLHAAEMFDYMQERTPEGVTIQSRTATPGEISVTASTLSEEAMGTMMSTISADPKWKILDVTNLTADKTKGISFTIIAKE